jgi:hypothetical protein
VFALDGGNSLGKDFRGRPPPAGGTGQRRVKARLIAEEWVAAGLDAAAIGSDDWLLGETFVFDLVKRTGFPAVAANLVCEGGERPFPAARVVERDGRSVGVVGVTTGTIPGCVATDPAEAAVEAHALLKDVDATVLLWPTAGEEANVAAREGLPFDFVLDASGRSSKAVPQRAGESWLLGGGIKTKGLGIVTLELGGGTGFWPPNWTAELDKQLAQIESRKQRAEERVANAPDERSRNTWRAKVATFDKNIADIRDQKARFTEGGANRMTVRHVALTDDVPDHPETQARVEAAKKGFADLEDASGAEVLARPMRFEAGPYAGTEACISCHPAQYNQWRQTGHARAIGSLVAVSRHRDEDCFSCHVTGGQPAEAAGFPVVIEASSDIGGGNGVQCEACHGPSRAHGKDPTNAAHTPLKDPPESLCIACHTPEQTEDRFVFADYLQKVTHPDPPKAE